MNLRPFVRAVTYLLVKVVYFAVVNYNSLIVRSITRLTVYLGVTFDVVIVNFTKFIFFCAGDRVVIRCFKFLSRAYKVDVPRST